MALYRAYSVHTENIVMWMCVVWYTLQEMVCD
jgi:hypothetical protein